MHICKICSKECLQLKKHLRNSHAVDLLAYLDTPEERLKYEVTSMQMRSIYRERSPFCIEYYQKRGFSDAAGQEKIVEYQSRIKNTPHPSTVEYWMRQGRSEDNAILEVERYKKSIGKVPVKDKLIKIWGEEAGIQRWAEHRQKMATRPVSFLSRFATEKEGLLMRCLVKGFGSNKTCPMDYQDFKVYARHCRHLTRLVLCAYRDVLDPDGTKLSRDYGINGYHLDHKFSIYGGFYHSVDPMKICSIENLRLVDAKENLRKSQFCIIELAEVKSYKTILDEEWLSDVCKERIRNVYCRTG